MYAEFFGLNRRPFRANPTGSEVFVGPQTARLMQGLKSALDCPDAIVSVTGAPGLGKSTLVRRALATMGDALTLVEMPRVKLGHDEVLDFLLEALGVTDVPAGTLRRFLLCRDVIAELAASNKGVCILVEDADRIGADALIEIEALTAAGHAEGHAGRVVLLGGQQLVKLLQSQTLVRIAQRTRLRFPVEPLNENELRGYLRHCIRLAGTEFDALFENGADHAVFEMSAGTPRLANYLVDSVLAAAAAKQQQKVSIALLAQVARDEYGIDFEMPVVEQPTKDALDTADPQNDEPAPAAVDQVEEDKQSNTVTVEELVLDEDAISVIQDAEPAVNSPLPDLDELAAELSEPAADAAPPVADDLQEAESGQAETAAGSATDTSIPMLFSSSRMPAPQALAALDASDVPAAPPVPPTIEDSAEPEAAEDEDVPAWDKESTLAELRPDLEALELALADSGDSDDSAEVETMIEAEEPAVELQDPTSSGVPEITLDIAIQQKIDEATEALQKHDATIAEEEIEDAPTPPDRTSGGDRGKTDEHSGEDDDTPDPELQAVAQGIANARSLEDVDDKMAETLFGEEFSAIAAQVAANAPPIADPEPVAVEDVIELVEEPLLAASGDADTLSGDEDSSAVSLEEEFKQVYGEDALEVSLQAEPPRGGLDLSASQRLATVRALNAEKKSATGSFATSKTQGAGPPVATPPQSIEEQINTSMTQTLKALNARPPSANDEDDDDEEKGGFFSRFRRS